MQLPQPQKRTSIHSNHRTMDMDNPPRRTTTKNGRRHIPTNPQPSSGGPPRTQQKLTRPSRTPPRMGHVHPSRILEPGQLCQRLVDTTPTATKPHSGHLLKPKPHLLQCLKP